MENKNRCESSFATRPIMYEVGARYQEIIGRDDLWAVSTEELNILQDVVNEAAGLLQDMADNKESAYRYGINSLRDAIVKADGLHARAEGR